MLHLQSQFSPKQESRCDFDKRRLLLQTLAPSRATPRGGFVRRVMWRLTVGCKMKRACPVSDGPSTRA